MSNYHLQPSDKPQALTPQALRSLRQDPVQGISRRTLTNKLNAHEIGRRSRRSIVDAGAVLGH